MKPYYQDDYVTLYHSDALDILPTLSGIGAVVTDPPYSSGGQYRGDRAHTTIAKYVQTGTLAYRPEFAGDHFDQRTFMMWAEAWLRLARESCAPAAPICSFTDWRQLPTLADALQFAGWTWRNVATWWKPGVRMQRGRFSSSSEFVIYGTNGPSEPTGMSSPQNVMSFAVVPEKQHIAQKPVEVMRWVLGVVPPDALVLDPFMGSGSTLDAAKSLGLKGIGIDSDERYCEVAAKRLSQEVLGLSA